MLADRLEQLEPFNHETAEEALRTFAADQGVKDGLLINAARTALTGQAVGPPMFDLFTHFGRERSARRLREAVQLIDTSEVHR